MPGSSPGPWGVSQGRHQGDAGQDDGQQPDDGGVGPGWTAVRHGQAPRLLPALGPCCWPDSREVEK